MMANQYARYGTYKTVENFNYTLSHGIDPGIFHFDIGGKLSDDPARDGDIVICDGIRAPITFKNCRMAEGGLKWNANSKMWNIEVRDRRWKWINGGTVTGTYNVRDDAGNNISTGDDKKSARALAILCLTALKESGYDASALPADEYPAVEWEYEPAIKALSDICERYACRIVLKTNDKVFLYKEGKEEDYKQDPRNAYHPEDYSAKRSFNDCPATIRLVGKREIYQVDLSGLEAVGLDKVNGVWQYVALASLSYKPAGGFYLGFERDITDKQLQAAAKKTVFKYYRLPATVAIGSKTVTRAVAATRWSQELIETATIDGAKKHRKPYIYGNYSTASAGFDPVESDEDAATGNATAHVDVDLSFDKDSACVVFNKEVFTIGTGGYVGATLKLACAFEGEPSTWTLDVAKYNKSIPVISEQERIIKRDDIRNEYIKSGTSWIEQTAAKSRADNYLQDEADKYANLSTDSKTYEWAGIIDLSPSGALDEVSWKMSSTGGVPQTIASFATSHSVLTKPPRLRKMAIDNGRMIESERQSRASDDPTGERLAPKIDTSGRIPSGDRRDQALPRQKLIYNASGEAIPAYSFALLNGSVTTGAYNVIKPNAASIDPALLVVTGAAAIPAGKKGYAAPIEAGKLWVAYTGTDPSVGNEIGTGSGAWTATVGKTGCKISRVDTINKRVCVSGMGGGGTITIAQLTSTPSNGTAKAKLVTISNGSVTVTGDEFDVQVIS